MSLPVPLLKYYEIGFIENDHFDDQECLALLRRSRFGRIAVSFKAVPVVFPVRYTLSDGELKFAVPEEQLAKALDKAVATLQADGFDEDSGRRWTAFAAGPTERLETIGSLGLGPSSLESDPVTEEWGGVFRLQPVILSGRWIDYL